MVIKGYWKARIENALEREKTLAYHSNFTVADRDYASDWNHCAVGETHPTGDNNAPNDQFLDSIGMAFYESVSDLDNPRLADRIYKALQFYKSETDSGKEALRLAGIDSRFIQTHPKLDAALDYVRSYLNWEDGNVG